MTLTTAEIAKLLAGEVLGDANATLTGFAMIDKAKAGDLTFAETPEYFAAAEASAATAIIASKDFASDKKPSSAWRLRVSRLPRRSRYFFRNPNLPPASIRPPSSPRRRKLTRPRTSVRIARLVNA